MAERITVKSPEGHYDILVEPGLLFQIRRDPGRFGLEGHVVVGTNTTLAPIYGRALVDALPNAAIVTMSDGEQHKSLETVARLYGELIQTGADRSSTLLALGGGVVGDTMGFVAATYMRGIRLVQVPTSLLAMVDSSVGGKVGVDLSEGKNLVGAFKQPDMVLIDPDVLQTLPELQWRCGMAEVIKHGLLADACLLDASLRRLDRATELIQRAVRVKVDIVEADPFETSVRAYLNLGHTFAHAIERVTEYRWLHGEAVGIGLLAAVKLSQLLSLCDELLPRRVEETLAAIELPGTLNGLDPDAIYKAMATDKKWRGGKSRFVLLEDIGRPKLVQDVSREDVLRILREIQ